MPFFLRISDGIDGGFISSEKFKSSSGTGNGSNFAESIFMSSKGTDDGCGTFFISTHGIVDSSTFSDLHLKSLDGSDGGPKLFDA